MKGKMKHRVCISSKEEAAESVASDNWLRSTTPPRRRWPSMHWSGVTKNYARAVEGAASQSLTSGALLVGVITCVGVCVCFGHKTTCVFALVFSVFFGNLMLEFLYKIKKTSSLKAHY